MAIKKIDIYSTLHFLVPVIFVIPFLDINIIRKLLKIQIGNVVFDSSITMVLILSVLLFIFSLNRSLIIRNSNYTRIFIAKILLEIVLILGYILSYQYNYYFVPVFLSDPYTVLPLQIFNWVSRPQEAFATNASAAIVVLLLITFAMNFTAIYFRNKSQERYK